MNFEKTKDFIGRVLITAIFIYAIPSKIVNFEQTLELIISKNITPYIDLFLLVSSISCLIIGSILFISGFNQRLGASLLLLFIRPTIFIFHIFPFQIKAILMNFGLVGGLMLGIKKTKFNSIKDLFYNQ